MQALNCFPLAWCLLHLLLLVLLPGQCPCDDGSRRADTKLQLIPPVHGNQIPDFADIDKRCRECAVSVLRMRSAVLDRGRRE